MAIERNPVVIERQRMQCATSIAKTLNFFARKDQPQVTAREVDNALVIDFIDTTTETSINITLAALNRTALTGLFFTTVAASALSDPGKMAGALSASTAALAFMLVRHAKNDQKELDNVRTNVVHHKKIYGDFSV